MHGREVYSVTSRQSFQPVMERSREGQLMSWLVEGRKEKCLSSLALFSLFQWDGGTNMQPGLYLSTNPLWSGPRSEPPTPGKLSFVL